MRSRRTVLSLTALFVTCVPLLSFASDHNEPDSVNSIFSDGKGDATDLYGAFGFPNNRDGEETLVVLLTMSPTPATGQFDGQVMHRLHLDADKRREPPVPTGKAVSDLVHVGTFLHEVVTNHFEPIVHPEIQVTYGQHKKDKTRWAARLKFVNFLGGDFLAIIDTNKNVIIAGPHGERIDAFIGGRDDPFFTDLNGFFTSIHYLPYFDKLAQRPFPQMQEPKEGDAIKTLARLDATGNFIQPLQWVYDHRDSRTHYNVNAIAIEVPVSMITQIPEERVIRFWGEGSRLKSSAMPRENRR